MPRIKNGRTDENIITNINDFVKKVIENGRGMIHGERQYTSRRYHDMSDIEVVPDEYGDDMFVVNCHNGIHYHVTDEKNLRNDLIEFLNKATDAHPTSKANVQVEYNKDSGKYELDNIRIYSDIDEALYAHYNTEADYIQSIRTGVYIK